MINSKRCPKCGKEWPATAEFWHRDKNQKDGFRNLCKECVKVYIQTNKERIYAKNREYYQEHRIERNKQIEEYRKSRPEWSRQKVARANAKYKQRHPEAQKERQRKGIKRNPTFSQADWDYCLEYFGHCCAVCGRPAGLWHRISRDHWIPILAPNYPGTVRTNILPLCIGLEGCNNRKKDKAPEVWLVEQFGETKARRILKRINAYFDHVRDRKQEIG